MTAGTLIRIERNTYLSEEIASLRAIQDLTAYEHLSPYTQQTLAFCHAWLSGQSSFEINTSGSTGTPKKILISREQMQHSAQATISTLGLKAGDQALVCINTAYIGGKMMLVRGLELGMPLTVIPPSSKPLEAVDEPIDFTALVPLQLKSMLEADDRRFKHSLNAMKAILVGGAPIDAGLEQSIQDQLKAPVYSTYGMTETVSHIALRKINGPEASDVYEVLPGVEIKQDARACISVKGKVSGEQWLQTNDIVEMLDYRHFRWLGRLDNVVNSGGVKLFADKLEGALQPAIEAFKIAERFFLAGLPDEKLGEKLCLIIERKNHLQLAQKEDLIKWMKAQLHPYEVPKQIIQLPEFILSPSGKIRRKHTLKLLQADSK
ncbi:O-succinylbenzoic acid--CoA ligase [Catalinimonas alkaloidigena]|uniref:AMP-binding protein n=1 Tax=Catalinimonas alkaloidigena TaxID=1075417 RepID=UPI002404F04D|nr:AMP-binding protein [Catalinimonas alkaloidigena]MDF9795006.1 O-succinylbenzoic acid--CoA ligase [Catalinimonas alkaloidigena]